LKEFWIDNVLPFLAALPPYVLSIVAAFCIYFAIQLARKERIKGASLLGAFAFLSVVLAYFPQLDSVQALSIQVRLRKNIDRAEEILADLKQLSILSAKSSYMSMAWNSRGMPAIRDRQAVLDEVQKQLTALQVSEAQKREASHPYVQMIGVDLYVVFLGIMESYATWKEAQLNQVPDPQRQDEVHKLGAILEAWRKEMYPGPVSELDNYDLQAYLKKATPGKIIDAKDIPNVEKLRQEILSLYRESKDQQRYSDATISFIEKYSMNDRSMYGGPDQKMFEVFGVKFASPRP